VQLSSIHVPTLGKDENSNLRKTAGNIGVPHVLLRKRFYTADNDETGSYRKEWIYSIDKTEIININRLWNIKKMRENKM
jgi:hypothetical protein